MSIKACELMAEAQKNPEKYEGKKYKTTFWDILDGYGKSHKEIIVKNGRLHFTDNDNLKVYISDYNELEEIKPEPKPVTFVEAAKSYKKLKYNRWDKFYTLSEVLEILSEKPQSTINEMLSGWWFIEE